MPEETTAAPPAEATEAPSAPETPESDGEKSDGNDWLRETAQGLIYSRPLDTAKRSEEEAAASAELRRGRRNGKRQERQEASEPAEADGTESGASEGEQGSSQEKDDAEFQRRVQAEVDRREAVRRQRAETQYERDLRQKDPAAYAKYKEQQEAQNAQSGALTTALKSISQQFDDATVTPLMAALPDDATRNQVLTDAGHGIPGRKEIVTRAIKALTKAAHDEGFAKGKESAQKTLRRSTAFRKELLSELRGSEDEPEMALGNGSPSGGGDWDMNDWMRNMTGKSGRGRSRE